MSGDRSPWDLDIPVYGTLMVYPKGSRAEADGKRFDTPGLVSIGPDDWFGFTFGAIADVTDEDVLRFAAALGDRRTLRDLNLGGCQQITDRGLGCLAPFERVEKLTLNTLSGTTPPGLTGLRRFNGLRELTLECTAAVDDTTAVALAGLRQLVDLNLNMCPGLTDAGAKHLSRLDGLESLGVNQARLTDRGVEILCRLRRLRWLALPTGQLTSRVLEYLAELPNLNYVSLPDCTGFLRRLLTGRGISRAGLARFQQAKPDCDVWSPEIYAAQQRRLAQLMRE